MVIDDKRQKSAIIYARVSSTDQTTNVEQIDVLKKELHRLNRYVLRVVEEKKSAKDEKDVFNPIEYMRLRPKFYNSCYLPATNKEYDELWIWKWDRFSRSEFQEILIKMFNKYNVDVISLIGSKERLGRKVENIVATEYIEDLKKRVRLKHMSLLSKNRVLNRPPLGYRFKRHKLIVDESNKDAVIKMFELTIKGLKVPEICSQIDIWRKKGSKKELVALSRSTYKRCLKNRVYEGFYSYEGEERKGVFETPYKDLFLKVQDKLNNIQTLPHHTLPNKTSHHMSSPYLTKP